MIQELLVQLYVSIFTIVGFEMLNKNYPYPCNEGILTPAWVEVYDFDEDSTYVTNFRKIVKNKDWEIRYELISDDCPFIDKLVTKSERKHAKKQTKEN
tara:strand:- start:952 stop:1245 length:294 start_codon:yes stop_codon:yes gene_type:complete